MNRTEIIKSVNAYIKNDHAKYALLINGAWGVGKTYLYEKYLSDAISSIEVNIGFQYQTANKKLQRTDSRVDMGITPHVYSTC